VHHDYEFKTADGRASSALYFFYWVPSNANDKERILYSSAKSNIVAALSGYKQFNVEEQEEIEDILKEEVQIGK